MGMRWSDRLKWARMAAWAVVCVPPFEAVRLVTPRPRRADRYCRLVRHWARWVLRGHPLSIENADRIPRDRPVIFVSNHQGNLDIPLLHAVMPVTFRWLCREDLFRAPLLGLALRRMDAIEVHRTEPRRAAISVRRTVAVLGEGHSVLIFPEGTWGDREGRMRAFKPGVLRIARLSGAPVVPLTIVGSHRVNPPFTSRLEQGAMGVVVHPPVMPTADDERDEATWMERLRATIAGPLPHGPAPAVARPDTGPDESPF